MSILEADLARLKNAQAKLAADVAKSVEAPRTLQMMIDGSSTASRNSELGLDCAFSSIQAVNLYAKVEASQLESQIAENAEREIAAEIGVLEARLAELAERKGALVRAAVKEASVNILADFDVAVDNLRQTIVQFCGLEKFLGVERVGKVAVVLPDPHWTVGGLGEMLMTASPSEIEKARQVFVRFGEVLVQDPSAPASFEFSAVSNDEPDESSLTPTFT